MRIKAMLVTMVMAQLAVATVAGAASVKLDMDRKADFAAFQTIRWAAAATRGAEAIADQRIRTALRAELEKKGYQVIEGGAADLVLDYAAVVRQRRDISDTGGPRFGRRLELRQHPEGTLVVSFAEAESGNVVWHGAVTDAIATSPDKADEKTATAVRKLLAEFPAAPAG